VERLDDRGGVHACGRAEGVAAEHRIVVGIGSPVASETARTRSFKCVRSRSIHPMRTQVDHQQIHRRITDPLADAEHRAVDARGAGLERGEAVDRAHVAIAVPVPVDAHVRHRSPRRRVWRSARRRARPAGVAWPTVSAMHNRCAPALMAVSNRAAQRVGIGARRVFGDVHHLQALTYPEPDRFLGAALQIVDRPVFGVLADRTRADEAAALDGQTGPLNDVGDRLNVGDDGAGDTVGLDLRRHSTISAASRSTSRTHMRAGAGESDRGGVDADAIEQVQDAQLLLDRRGAHRRRLQSVAQRLVIELHDRRLRRRRLEVPVEDQVIHDGPSL
jgi:hypothetical protein